MDGDFAGPLPTGASPRHNYPQAAVEDFVPGHASWAMDTIVEPSITGNRRRPLPVIGVTRATRLWSAPMGLFSPPSTPYAPPMMPAPPPPPPTPVDKIRRGRRGAHQGPARGSGRLRRHDPDRRAGRHRARLHHQQDPVGSVSRFAAMAAKVARARARGAVPPRIVTRGVRASALRRVSRVPWRHSQPFLRLPPPSPPHAARPIAHPIFAILGCAATSPTGSRRSTASARRTCRPGATSAPTSRRAAAASSTARPTPRAGARRDRS